MAVGNPITDLSGPGNYVPIERTLTINGVTFDLSANRSWTVGGGSVTSVAMSVPTGFQITGSPITSSGTLGLSFATGYSLPTNVKQSNWDDAYTWVSNFPTLTGNTGKYLTNNGSVLSWGTLDFSNITGTLPVTKGGTGVVTLTGVVIGNGTNNFSAVTGGPLQLLRVNASATGYEFFSASFGTVTSVAMSVPTGFAIGGSPITSSGTLALSFASGYSLPTNSSQTNWDTAYTFVNNFPNQASQAGKYLTTNGSALSWATLDLSTISGTLPVTKGGTGVVTLTGIVVGNGTNNFSAITGGPLQLLRVNASATGYEFFNATFLTNPMIALGDIIYGAGAGTPTRLAGNSTGNKMFLSSTGSGGSPTAPQWETIEFTEIGGTLAVNQGGTGATSLSGILVGNGTGAFTALPSTTPQQLLRVNTLGTAYEWFTPSFLAAADIQATTPLVWNSGTKTMSIPQASNTTNGFLSSTDWLTFSSKQPAITLTTSGNSGASTFNVITGALNIPEYTLAGLGGMSNPMTGANGAGDIIYGNAIGNPTRRAPNVTTTKMFLSSTGDGTSGNAPVWEQITAATIGAVSGSGTTNVIPKFTGLNSVGDSIMSESSTLINIGANGSASEYGLQIGHNRSGNGYAYIDLVGDATYNDYGMRLLRNNGGANTTSVIEHRGTGDLVLKTVDAGRVLIQTGSTDAFSVISTRQARLHAYTSTTSFTGTAVGVLAFDANGYIITQSNIPQSGSYTPTLSGLSNTTSVTAYNCQYMRIGNVVSVSGRIEVNATNAAALTIVSLSLPYNTNMTSVDQCNGVVTSENDNISGIIIGITTSADVRFTPTNAGSQNYFFSLHYEIV